MKSRPFSSAAMAVTIAFSSDTAFAARVPQPAPLQETPAAALSNPNFPNIGSIQWILKDKTEATCGVNEDRGEINLADGTTDKFVRRPDGVVHFMHGPTNGSPANYLIDGSRVVVLDNGRQEGLSNRDADSVVSAFGNTKALCDNFTNATIAGLLPHMPNHTLHPNQDIKLKGGIITEIRVFGLN